MPTFQNDMIELPTQLGHGLAGVLTDIDDTLTTDGAITPDALAALASLKAAGLNVIAITGRPAGWSEPFALEWPVDAIVAENGAVAMRRRPGTEGLEKFYLQDLQTRKINHARMQGAASRVLREVPGTLLTQDSPGRETDIAIDHSEFTKLPQSAIDETVRVMREEGMTATVSSIHINGWYGSHDKLEGARWIVQSLLGRDIDAEKERWVYVGDSTNDELMFGFFPLAVGVANVRRFAGQLRCKPRFITRGERGAGFSEVANAVLAARRAEGDI